MLCVVRSNALRMLLLLVYQPLWLGVKQSTADGFLTFFYYIVSHAQRLCCKAWCWLAQSRHSKPTWHGLDYQNMDIHSTYMCYIGLQPFTKALWLLSIMMCRSAGSWYAGMLVHLLLHTLLEDCSLWRESWAVTMQFTGGLTTLEHNQQGLSEPTCRTHTQLHLQLLTIGRVQAEQGRQAQR